MLFAIVYYYATIGLTDEKHPDRSILRFADVRPKLHEEPEHHPQYGYRKEVQVSIHPDSAVSRISRRGSPFTDLVVRIRATYIGSSEVPMRHTGQALKS
jgi:hypothetical protein